MHNQNSDPFKVLFVDDDPAEHLRVRRALERCDHNVDLQIVKSVAELADVARTTKPDVFLVDISIDNDEDAGIKLVPKLKRLVPGAAIIMYSSFDTGSLVRRAIAAGADDYITKDQIIENLGERLKLLVQKSRITNGLQSVPDYSKVKTRGGSVAIVRATMNRIRSHLDAVIASSVGCIHVHGESGTGKELIGDIVEALIAPAPMVRVNCAAIPDQLVESELFGHRRGAFTGATNDKKGYFEQANGGAIFLDEIALLSESAQAKVLRAIENQEILPVGSEGQPRKIKVRVISATNERLETAVRRRKFRLDLWQRLAEVEYELVPLRDRASEIPHLAAHFASTAEGGPFILTQAAMNTLKEMPWREGNVRELRNCIRAMTAFPIGRELTPMSIPKKFFAEKRDDHDDDTEPLQVPQGLLVRLADDAENPLRMDSLEDQLLAAAIKELVRRQGSMSMRKMAEHLKIGSSTMHSRVRGLIKKGAIASEEIEELFPSLSD